jgi:ion transport protein
MPRHGSRALRHRLYEILEHGSVGDRAGRLVSWLIVLLIVINLIAVALESVPEFEARYAASFLAIELFSLLVFTIEYGLRMWVAVEHTPSLQAAAWKARLNYATSPLGLIDLFAVLPFWLTLALPAELKILLVLRIVRFLKLARYSLPGQGRRRRSSTSSSRTAPWKCEGITDEREPQAFIVAAENAPGVKPVNDHLVWIEYDGRAVLPIKRRVAAGEGVLYQCPLLDLSLWSESQARGCAPWIDWVPHGLLPWSSSGRRWWPSPPASSPRPPPRS